MCELLGMSANVPTDICFSFSGLIKRGGVTGPHRDGWGIAFYQGKGVHEFKDPNPSCQSQIAQFIRGFPIKSKTVISHIRLANSGRICLENTHPFSRELWGRYWCFAHNGQLKGFKLETLGRYRPVGTTDSEHAFCWLLENIYQRFGDKPPQRPQTFWRFLHRCCNELMSYGVFNMLLSDSRYLYAFCSNKLTWITRQAPFGKAQLRDEDLVVDFSQETTPDDIVTVVSTEPLTHDETWHKMSPGQLQVVENGQLIYVKDAKCKT
jgi:glutamine amidotransferase